MLSLPLFNIEHVTFRQHLDILSFAVLSPIAQFYENHLAKTESQKSELLVSQLHSREGSDVIEVPKDDVIAPEQVMDSSDISESFFGNKVRYPGTEI